MNRSTITSTFHPSRLGLTTVALVLAASVSAVGQSESPDASASPLLEAVPSPAAGSADDLVAAIPAELAGVPLDPANVTVLSGPDITQGSEALERQYQALEDATGVPVAEMVLVNAFVQTPDEEFVFFGGIQVPGADSAVMLDTLLAIVAEDGGATASESELGDLAVTVIVEDGLVASTTYVYPRDDILWLVLGPEDVALEALLQVSG